MARDGSGNYNLPAGQPVSTGTTISSTVHNALASDVASALTQSLSKDGQTTPTANLPMGGFKFTGVADGTASNHFATVGQLQSAAVSLAGSVSGTDTITANLNPAILSYTSGLFVSFIVANTNATTTPTLALNGLSAKTIVRPGGQPLAIGDLVTTKLAHLQYDGTNFVLLSPAVGSYPALIPTGSTVPANGVYLPAANTVGIASNTTLRASVNSTGNWVFAAPSSGTACTINGLAGEIGLQVAGNFQGNWPIEVTSTGGATTGRVAISFVRQGGTNKQWAIGNNPDGASDNAFGIRDITRGVIPLQIGTSGNVTINAPSSGTALTVSGPDSAVIAAFLDTTSTNGVYMWMGDSVGGRGYMGFGSSTFSGAAISDFGIAAASGVLRFSANGGTSTHMQIANAGNVSIAAPSSGAALAVTGVSGSSAITATDGTVNSAWQSLGASGALFGTTTAHNLIFATGGSTRITLAAASGNVTFSGGLSGITTLAMTGALSGATTGAFSAGLTCTTLGMGGALTGATTGAFSAGLTCTTLGMGGALTGATTGSFSGAVGTGALTVTGAMSASTTISDQAGDVRIIPQNAQTGNYTCVLSDAGKHIYHAAGAGAGDTYTIPANGSVAYTIGTAITFINRDTTNSVSIAITTDTLTMAVTGTTGTRTLAPYGTATAVKITATEWLISGSGLS